MGVEDFLGHQIWHRAGRWEVFDAEGNLVAEGRGSTADAQHWIWERIIEMAERFASADRKH